MMKQLIEPAIGSGGGGSGVDDVNSVTGSVDIIAGSGISVTTSGQDITITNTGGGGSPGGSSGDIQYNNAGAFAGDTDFTTDGSGNITTNSIVNEATFSSDGGEIVSDGSGNLQAMSLYIPSTLSVVGTSSLDNNAITTDGAGNIVASSLTATSFIFPSTAGFTDDGSGDIALTLPNDSDVFSVTWSGVGLDIIPGNAGGTGSVIGDTNGNWKIDGYGNFTGSSFTGVDFTGDGAGLTNVAISIGGSPVNGSIGNALLYGDGTNLEQDTNIQTDGSGNLAAGSFTGDGSGLTNVPFTLTIGSTPITGSSPGAMLYGDGSNLLQQDPYISTDGSGNLTTQSLNTGSLILSGGLQTDALDDFLGNGIIGLNGVTSGLPTYFYSDGSGSTAGTNISWDSAGNLTAVSFYGDGSNLTGIVPAAGGLDGSLQYNLGGFLGGDSIFTDGFGNLTNINSLNAGASNFQINADGSGEFAFNNILWDNAGNITARSFTGDGSGLVNVPVTLLINSTQVTGYSPQAFLYGDGAGTLQAEAAFTTDGSGNLTAGTYTATSTPGFSGDGSGLTNLGAPGSNDAILFSEFGVLDADSRFNFNPSTGFNIGSGNEFSVDFSGNAIGNTFSGNAFIGNVDLSSASTITDNSSSTGTSGQVLTAGTGGQVVWATGGGSGANTALSNLASVAINTDLLPGSGGFNNVGSLTDYWSQTWAVQNIANSFNLANVNGGSSTTEAVLHMATPTGLYAASGVSTSSPVLQSSGFGLFLASDSNTQAIFGSKDNGAGSTGSVTLLVGANTGGTRGNVVLNGAAIDASSTNIINVTDPTTAQMAATKHYVDNITTLASLALPLSQTTGVLSIASGGTNNGSLGVAAGGIIASDGSKLTNVGAGTSGQYLKSNGASAPTWGSGSAFTPVTPTVQAFTSSSGTYTTPTSPAPLYLKVTLVAAGGGGASTSTGTGSNGGNTTFGASLTAGGGVGAGAGANYVSGSGGTNTATGTILINVAGGNGSGAGGVVAESGGTGGSSSLGGGGGGGSYNAAGLNSAANTGGGGGGGGATAGGAGGGGGAGGTVVALISSPSSTYAYAVGAGGAGSATGTPGGNGGSGYILVEEFYQ